MKNVVFWDIKTQFVDTKIRRPVAVAQSVQFACGLKATELSSSEVINEGK
jgi:hypothetical protein